MRYLLAVVGKVDSKVHEIILPKGRRIHDALEKRLVYLVGNVAQHDLLVLMLDLK